MNSAEQHTVYGFDGSKVGVVVKEGSDWAAYNLSDIEVYRGPWYTVACHTLQGTAG
jgi:hypothetical protein